MINNKKISLLLFHKCYLRGKILAGRKFSGNKIWRNWRHFSLAYGRKPTFWWELNLANKQKIEYDQCFFIQKWYIFYILPKNQDKTKENHNNDVYETNENNQKVHNRHKKIKIRVIKVRKKNKKSKKKLILKFSENSIWQMPKKRKFWRELNLAEFHHIRQIRQIFFQPKFLPLRYIRNGQKLSK